MVTLIIGIIILGIVIAKYGNFPENCIRTHFRSDYSRWLSLTTCFSCLKIGHISRHCPTKSKAPSSEFKK